jgi:hypothetical protein
MVGGDTKSTSSTDLSQPTTSEGDVAGENMGTSDGATYLKPSLEEGIADAAPGVVPVAAPSATPNVDGMPLQVGAPISEAADLPSASSSKSIADAIIDAGDKHAALLRDLVGQLSSSRLVRIL